MIKQVAWKNFTFALGFVSCNSQLFPSPPVSLEPYRFSCCPRDQSLTAGLGPRRLSRRSQDEI